MIYTHFIGHVGKDAKIINGKNGDFLSMDVVVSDYFKGQETTTWIRVRSNRHANLQKWLTKGKMLLVEGVLAQPAIWVDKEGESHVQLSVSADIIHFVNSGKNKENDKTGKKETVVETTKNGKAKEDDPLGSPEDNDMDVPY
jgi:single-strand DNA-binding protein